MRRKYLDNIRWAVVLLVVAYHVCYNFSSVTVVKNIAVSGIPQMSIVEYLLYPWFMCCLFAVAGVSARLALGKTSKRKYLKSRARKLLVPSVAGIFIYGWINGYITNLQSDIFMGQSQVPGPVKYLIFCMIGSGVLWFAQELFILTAALLLLLKLDKKDRISGLCSRVRLPALLLLAPVVWLSSLLLNTPVIEVYRNGIYLFFYLAGYYLFSQERVMEELRKASLPLGIAALALGIVFTAYRYGQNYTDMAVLQAPLTNLYVWITVLAVFGCASVWLDFSSPFTEFMAKRSYGLYILHYPVLVPVAYVLVTYLKLPMICNYAAVLLITLVLSLGLYELVRRIPGLRTLALGQ